MGPSGAGGGAQEAACETSTPGDALDHSEQHKREFCLFLGLNFLLLSILRMSTHVHVLSSLPGKLLIQK